MLLHLKHMPFKAAESIFREHDQLIVTGGTGLYLKAFTSGFDAMPAIPAAIREAVRKIGEAEGIAGLRQILEKEDPVFAAGDEMQNPQRMMRALEFVRTTGTSIRNYQRSETAGTAIQDHHHRP